MMVNTSMKMNLKKSKQFPFGRGNMLSFLRSDNSYHSVDLNNISERKSIQIAIYYKKIKANKSSIYFRNFPVFLELTAI